MSKSVLISIQPYWCFLIIAKEMGWDIKEEKTIEVRKSFPKDEFWNKKVIIYCSKDKKSFGRIPKEYQPLMERFLGKVIGEFTCDKIEEFTQSFFDEHEQQDTEEISFYLDQFKMSYNELWHYVGLKNFYGWHISDLKIYDKPKELSEFYHYVKCESCVVSGYESGACIYDEDCLVPKAIERPFQSWGYVEDIF